jgi:hypothetical protein
MASPDEEYLHCNSGVANVRRLRTRPAEGPHEGPRHSPDVVSQS